MSEVKVDKISPKTGTAMTVGDSGDTFTVPSGATLTVAGALNVTGTTSLADGTVAVAELDIDGATDIGAAIVDADLFVVDAALLLESGYTDFFNSILLITSHKSIRIRRIKMRQNIPIDQIEKRMALQMSDSEKKKLVQNTIANNRDLQELYMKLEQFYKKIIDR